MSAARITNVVYPMVMLAVCAVHAQTRAGAPQSPRDVAWYEVDRIKALTLNDLNWHEVDRRDENGVTVIIGTFDAFDWNTFDSKFRPITLRWLQRGALFLPPGYPNVTGNGRAVTYNRHDAALDGEPVYTVWGVELARAFEVPVFIHGWDPALTWPAGYGSFHEMQFPLFRRMLRRGFCQWGDVPFDGSWMFNGSPLVKGDLVAITAVQRLAESEGGRVDRVGALGISKEGGSHWILAAIDDRLDIVAPGGAYGQDLHALRKAYESEWGRVDRYAGARFGISELVSRIDSWERNTELGAIASRISEPVHFQDLLYPRFVLISGDVGVNGMHDKGFPLGAESSFLRQFRHPAFQYVRIPNGSGVSLDGGMSARAASLLPMVADLLTDDPAWPKIQSVRHDISKDRRFRVHASMENPDLPGLELSIWAAASRNRWWTEVENGQWQETPLTRVGDNEWASPWSSSIGREFAAAYIIEARTIGTRGSYWFYRTDTSQPTFLWPHPALRPLPIIWGKCRP